MSKTIIDKVLEVLAEGNLSSSEIAEKLELSHGTVRSYLSTLTHLGFVKPVPEEKRGKPFMLTEQGKKHLESLSKGKGE